MTEISGDNYLGLVIYFVDRELDEWSWEYWGTVITEDMDRVRLLPQARHLDSSSQPFPLPTFLVVYHHHVQR